MPHSEFDAVVIGSGFGGTIAALTLANYFKARNKRERICLLERGQWWISHELPLRAKDERRPPPEPPENMREFLHDRGEPHNFWAHPDNVEGVIDLASKARIRIGSKYVNRFGLYDYRLIADNVHVIAASGVGGGSLVYSNVTLEPHKSVYQDWPTQRDGGNKLEKYFEPARIFIGVNRITTVSGLGPNNAKLEKSRIFQEAANTIRNRPEARIINPVEDFPGDPNLGFAVDLSITDVPTKVFTDLTISDRRVGDVTESEIAEVLKQQNQQNVCQRQGRCNLGCLPGARHTLNKKMVAALQKQAQDGVLNVQALCEAELIEFMEPEKRFRVTYKRYDKETDTITTEHILAERLVVAAGTLGTNELLLKSKAKGLKLSEKMLGMNFSTDGDLFGFMRLEEKRIDITRGPINTCHAQFATPRKKEFAFTIEDTTLSKMVAPFFATLLDLQPDQNERASKKKRTRERETFLSTLDRRIQLLVHRIRLLVHRIQLLQQYGLLGGLTQLGLLLGFTFSRIQKLLTQLLRDEAVQELLTTLANPEDRPMADPNPDPWKSVRDRPDPLVQAGVKIITGVLDRFTKDHSNPFASPEERLSRYFVFSCMGLDKADGRLKLGADWEKLDNITLLPATSLLHSILRFLLRRPHPPTHRQLELENSNDFLYRNREIFEEIRDGMNELAKEIEPGSEAQAPTWNFDSPRESSLILLHPLGGCIMGHDADGGVVNSYGQVFNNNPSKRDEVYPNFYVMDGSIVPSALGVNSSLTIAALAFRCAENMVGGTPDYWPDNFVDPNQPDKPPLIKQIMQLKELPIP